eukprot:scaffold376266_cov37-Prasinocladus_malaysianus.AAC.1
MKSKEIGASEPLLAYQALRCERMGNEHGHSNHRARTDSKHCRLGATAFDSRTAHRLLRSAKRTSSSTDLKTPTTPYL